MTTLDGPVVEKKVPLPDRWLRGFAEAQVTAAGFDLRAELPAAEAVRFLRSLPRSTARGASRGVRWVAPAGRVLRPTTRPAPGAVCLPGPERLSALQRVLRHASALRVYGPALAGDAATASAWEVVLPGMRLTLTLSPEASRGFSGEGGGLDALAGGGSRASPPTERPRPPGARRTAGRRRRVCRTDRGTRRPGASLAGGGAAWFVPAGDTGPAAACRAGTGGGRLTAPAGA